MSRTDLESTDLEPYLGMFGWEQHLSENIRQRLGLYRLVNADPEHAEDFASTYARRFSAGELAEDLEDAGDDLALRAEARALFEMDCYPVWLGDDD